MGWKEFVVAYFSFTRRDIIGIVVVMFLIVFVFFSPKLFKDKSHSSYSSPDTAWIAAVKRLEKKEDQPDKSSLSDENTSTYQHDRTADSYFASRGELFNFDPNTLSSDGWERLGIRDKTIRTIQNYLSKGGHFYKPEDLSKVYGLRKEDYERLAPYIQIERKQTETNPFKRDETTGPPVKTERYKTVDINTADTSAFIALPGIGSRLAERIISFRDKLGGFYSISQVAETFGLADSTYQKIKQYLILGDNSVKKININMATMEELKAHPYIRHSIANPVIAYRNEHGPFSKVEDVKKVMAVTTDIYNKIAPYLTTQ